MPYPMFPRWVLRALLAAGVVLLAGVATSGALAALVGLLGDDAGCRVLSWVAVVLAVALVTDLVCLVFALAFYVLSEPWAIEPEEGHVTQEGGISAGEARG